MKLRQLFKLFQALMAMILFLFLVACSTPSGSPDTTNSTKEAPVTLTATPVAVPHPDAEVWEMEELIRAIDPSIFKLAVMLPYGGRGPSDTTCSDFWSHHIMKHINGAGSPNTMQEVIQFLAAIESGEAVLTKAATRMGGGLVSLFKYKGQQWLMFIGENLRPSIYRPAGNIQASIRRALGRDVLKQTSKKLQTANKTAARCFRETTPQTVTVTVENTISVPISEFIGSYDFNISATPVGGINTTAQVLVPVVFGSYGMVIPIQGTPPPFENQANYTYSPEHVAFLWTPEGGQGLTPSQMAEVIFMGGGTFVVVGALTISAELWVPVVVIGAPSTAALLPAFAQ